MTDRSDQILSQLNIYDYVHSRIVYCIHVNLPCSVSSRLFSTPSRFLASFLSSLFSDQFNLKHQSVKFIIWRVYGVRVSNFYVLSMSWSFTWLNKKKGEEDKNDHSPTWLTLHDTKVDWTNTGQRRSVLICPLGLVEQAGKYTYFPLLILHVTSRGRVYPVLTENRFDVVCSVICVAHHPGATEKMKDLSHKCQRAYITHMSTMLKTVDQTPCSLRM